MITNIDENSVIMMIWARGNRYAYRIRVPKDKLFELYAVTRGGQKWWEWHFGGVVKNIRIFLGDQSQCDGIFFGVAQIIWKDFWGKSQFGVFFDGVVNNILGEFFGFDRRQFGIPVGAQDVLGHQWTCALLADNHYCYATAKYHLMLLILQWNQTNPQIIAM